MKPLLLCVITVCIFALFSCSPNDASLSANESGTPDTAATEKIPNINDSDTVIDDVYDKIYSQNRDYFLACYSNGDLTELGLFHFIDRKNILLMDVSMGSDSYRSCCLDLYTLYKIEYPYLYCYDIRSADVEGSATAVSLADLECDAGFDRFEAITCCDGILYFQLERYVSAGNYITETYTADVQNDDISAVDNDDIPSSYRQFNVDEFMSKLEDVCRTDVENLSVVRSNIRLNRYGKIESFLIESDIDGTPVNILASFGAGDNVSIDCLQISKQSEMPSNTVSIMSFLYSVSNYIGSADFIRNDCVFYVVNYNDPVSLESYNISEAELTDAVEKENGSEYQQIKDDNAFLIPFKESDTSIPVFDGIKLIHV